MPGDIEKPKPSYGLDPNFPLQVEDASPTPEGKIELQVANLYQRSRDDKDSYDVESQLKWGIWKDVDFHLTVPAYFGNDSTTGSGQIQVNSQWEFLEEAPDEWWPAMAVEGDLNLPTGTGDYGLDTAVQFIATKTVIPGETQGQVHVNFTVSRNADKFPDERRYTYAAIVGYSQALTRTTAIVFDLGRGQSFTHDEDSNFAEVGFIQAISEKFRIAVGVGVGIGDDSPTYTGNVAFQYEF